MKRPFAQINFLTDDIETAKTGGLTIDENTQSSVTISNAATTLDPFTNTVGGITEAEVIFGDAKMPIAEKLTIGAETSAKDYNCLLYTSRCV